MSTPQKVVSLLKENNYLIDDKKTKKVSNRFEIIVKVGKNSKNERSNNTDVLVNLINKKLRLKARENTQKSYVINFDDPKLNDPLRTVVFVKPDDSKKPKDDEHESLSCYYFAAMSAGEKMFDLKTLQKHAGKVEAMPLNSIYQKMNNEWFTS